MSQQRYAPEKIQYGLDRYINETKRLYSVLDSRLEGREYLVGEGKGKYSIAYVSSSHVFLVLSDLLHSDIKAFPWVLSLIDCPY